MPDHDDPEQEGVSGIFEAARKAREEREKALGRIFGGAKESYDQRKSALEGLFKKDDTPPEPSPLGGFVERARASKDARLKEEGTLFERERQERLEREREMARRLLGREPKKEEEEPPPPPGKKKPRR